MSKCQRQNAVWRSFCFVADRWSYAQELLPDRPAADGVAEMSADSMRHRNGGSGFVGNFKGLAAAPRPSALSLSSSEEDFEMSYVRLSARPTMRRFGGNNRAVHNL